MAATHQVLASTIPTSGPPSGNLIAWLNAGPTWCFSDTAGTTPCAVGDFVKVWKDQQTTYNFATTSLAVFPKLQQASGLYYVEWDNTANSGLQNASLPMSGSVSMMMACSDTLGGTKRMFNGLAINGVFSLRRGDGNAFFVSGSQGYTPISDSNAHVVDCYKTSGSAWNLNLDGVAQTLSSATTSDWGTGMSFGANGSHAETFQGRIYAALFYSANLSAPNKALAYTWLGNQCGLTL